MNRRKFGLMTASSLTALAAGGRAYATTADKAALLKTTLTPLGAERAGNADGSIPAWTGGLTTPPPGWSPDQISPNLFADEKPLLTIDSSNYADHADRLSEGVVAMIKKYGFSVNVYPTHRTAAAPQWVYDNTYQNALNAKPDPAGARFGITGAYGGIPFPIPDTDENQGAEIIWNHICRWFSSDYTARISSFIVSGGQSVLGVTYQVYEKLPYYDPNGSAASFDGTLDRIRVNVLAPANQDGEELLQIDPTNPSQQSQEIYQLLAGQGRVRKAPELAFDTPSGSFDGIGNFDEFFGFFGSPIRYNWKFIEKKEMYIPYNNNALILHSPSEVVLPNFINPQYTRWELHRVWVLDATVAPGQRNVITHRRMYIDEDTWMIGVVDEWDAQGNLWRILNVFNQCRPDLPGTIYSKEALYNIQTNQYALDTGPWVDPKYGGPVSFGPIQSDLFNPNALAAQSQF